MKKILLVTVTCLAVLALMAGVAVAVTGADAEIGAKADACECGGDCAEGGGHQGSGKMGSHRDEVKGEIVGLLGLSLEDMEAQLSSGKTMAELAEEKGVTTDQVLETITSKVGGILDTEVAAGNMSPEKAEDIKSFVASRAADCIENGCGDSMGMSGRGMGQRGKRMGGDCDCGCSSGGE